MPRKNNKPSVWQSILKGLVYCAVLVYIAYTVGLSIDRNYQTNQQINRLKSDIATLNDQISELQYENIYYQTDSFKEVEARRRLGAKAPDEKVVIIPKQDQNSGTIDKSDPAASTNSGSVDEPTPNSMLWWRFLFGGE
jgi:cell division protein FtsB